MPLVHFCPVLLLALSAAVPHLAAAAALPQGVDGRMVPLEDPAVGALVSIEGAVLTVEPTSPALGLRSFGVVIHLKCSQVNANPY